MLAGLMACAIEPDERGNPKGESMSFDQLAQTDFNRTVTIAMRDNLDTIYRLREKLYRRNPIQWQRGGFQSMQEAIEASQHSIENGQPPEYRAGLHDIEVLSGCLSDDFTGDREGALVFGLCVLM